MWSGRGRVGRDCELLRLGRLLRAFGGGCRDGGSHLKTRKKILPCAVYSTGNTVSRLVRWRAREARREGAEEIIQIS